MLRAMMARFLAVVVMALAALTAVAAAQTVPRRAPVVVELYTSQGCSQCPRANRLLGTFAREPNVLALTFAVDYWDYLGWNDTFAQPRFTERQRLLSRAMGRRGLITPQLVFNGARQSSANDWDEARAILDQTLAAPFASGLPEASVQRLPSRGVRVAVGSGSHLATDADVWLVSYDPGPVTVQVTGGENARRRITHYNLVRSIERVGGWNGAPVYFERSRCAPQCAALVQERNGGRILAAAFTR